MQGRGAGRDGPGALPPRPLHDGGWSMSTGVKPSFSWTNPNAVRLGVGWRWVDLSAEWIVPPPKGSPMGRFRVSRPPGGVATTTSPGSTSPGQRPAGAPTAD